MSNLLKIHKKSYKNIGIYYIRYIIIKSINPLYMIIGKLIGYIEEKIEVNF